MATTVESLYPPELIQAVGHVVMSAAWVEDKAGELVNLPTLLPGGDPNIPAKGWAASGEQLTTAFEKVAGKQLADRLRQALEHRNDVVHGVFVEGEMFAPQGTSGAPSWVTMKRQFGRSKPAEYSLKGWKELELDALAAELSAIEDLIDDEISYMMGLKNRPDPATNP